MADISVWILLLFFLIIFLLGVPGNLTILRVYLGHKRKTSTDVLLISLAVSDLVFCLSIPNLIVSTISPCDGGSNLSCRLLTSINLITLYYSILLTGTIALDRYYAVCKPLSRKITPKRAAVISLSCYIFSMFIGGIVGFDSLVVPVGSANSSTNGTVCTTCEIASGINDRNNYLGLLIAAIYFAAVLVFFAIAILYGLVYATVRRQVKIRAAMGVQSDRRMIQTVSDQSNSVSAQAEASTRDESYTDTQDQDAGSSTGGGGQIRRGAQSSHVMQQKITRMLVIITALLWGSWAPSVVVIYFNRSDPDYDLKLNPVSRALLNVLNNFYFINYGANFVMYFMTNGKFRQETMDIIRHKCKRVPKTYK